ncbi:MAG: uridine kinase [Deltaproteobacteria bacterium]|nr:uridine kinase [Deltaproteobacteria bacterium]
MTALLVGIAGGSGSGKTALAEGVAAALPAGQAAVLPADAYYRDLGHLPPEERVRRNFDEPDALEGERLASDISRLRQGEAIERPAYDFATHARLPEPLPVAARPVVLVEGIFVLAIPAVRKLLALKVFVTASEPTRLARRMSRDVGERGRTRDSVVAQFARQTRPMHERHVAPSQAWADLVVSGEEELAQSVARVSERIRRLLNADCQGLTYRSMA